MPRSDTLTFGFEKDRKILESCLDILRASRVFIFIFGCKKMGCGHKNTTKMWDNNWMTEATLNDLRLKLFVNVRYRRPCSM
jgi:hypothetical protein